jgi:hypothetical protein
MELGNLPSTFRLEVDNKFILFYYSINGMVSANHKHKTKLTKVNHI